MTSALPLLLACAAATAAPGPDRFPLFPAMGYEEASGTVTLRQPWSPFGVSIDEEGRPLYEVAIEVSGLPPVSDEGEVYRVWLTTPGLEPVVHAGAAGPAGEARATIAWPQLLVVVSRESADRIVTEGERWAGPIVLRGFSAGARVTPLAQHSLFRQTPM